ncbi:MAG TPA: DUF2851 family protein [Ktedonobacterales bacterium]|nr:DUF2851 family protein [Ktedonobacterales bacterium]
MRGGHSGEAGFARRWAAGAWRGWMWRTEQGDQFTLIFPGRRGGPAGPDVRGAILARADGTRIRGDVEPHLRPGGWYAHARATDPRYDDVMLHATPNAGTHGIVAVPLASGGTAPQAALERALPPQCAESAPLWPCEHLYSLFRPAAVRLRVLDAGTARFARRAQACATELVVAGFCAVADRARLATGGRVLTVALAEGLGFGRSTRGPMVRW